MFSCTKPSCELSDKYENMVFEDVKFLKQDEIHIQNPKPELLSALYKTNFRYN